MSAARSRFLTSSRAYQRAVQSPALLGNSPPRTRTDHTSRLLRNGAAVVGLAIIEDFLRDRSTEVLIALGRGALPLSALPPHLQQLVTVDTTRLLVAKVRAAERDGEDPLPLIQATGRSLASSARTSMTVPTIALHWGGSNVTVDHVETVLKALQVGQPWVELTTFARRCGFPLPGSLKDVFRSAIKERHRAAHEALNDVVVHDVRSFGRHSLAVAIGFDALLSRAARLCRDRDPSYAGGALVSQSAVGIRFLDDTGAGYEESLGPGTPVLATHATASSARRPSVARAKASGEVVLQRDRNGIPVWWSATDIS
jgi:hypothetical protein